MMKFKEWFYNNDHKCEMKNVYYIMVVAAIVLLSSCGKSRSAEVENAAKAAAEGIFGDAGKEFVYLMDDYASLKSELEEQETKLKEKFENLGENASEAEANKFMEEGQKIENEKRQKEDEFSKQYEAFVEGHLGLEVPTEIAEGVPMKLLKPFAISSFNSNTMNIELEAQVELTDDRPALGVFDRMGYPLYSPTMILQDGEGNTIGTSTYLKATFLGDYGKPVAKGTQETLKATVILTGAQFAEKLAAKKMVIRWDKPYGSRR